MDTQYAYAAGLIDGEGTITLSIKQDNSQWRYPVVSVSSTTYQLVEYLKQNYGGSISNHKIYQAHHKPSYSWKVVNNAAIDFLQHIVTYLKEPEKLRRANLILSKYKTVTIRNGKYSEEQAQQKLLFQTEFFHPSQILKGSAMSL